MNPNDVRAAAAADGSQRPADLLCSLLLESLGELAAAGRIEMACRIAGRAYVALRREDALRARRFDALLHRLTKHLNW